MKNLFFLLSIFLASISLHAQDVSQTERDALIALYNATDGPNWTNSTNWNTAQPVSTWYGVTVTNNSVTEIFLNNNNLVGTIPPEIGVLSSLYRLILPYNQLSGEIPIEISNLVNLFELNLSQNQLSGSIPVQICSMVNLGALSLNTNQLSGSIPPEIGNLTNLITLGLAYNQFSGSIPVEIGNLVNMKWSNLSQNQLTGVVPAGISNMTNLIALQFYDNQLSGPLPDLLNLNAMTVLWMQDNLFTFKDIEPLIVPLAPISNDFYYHTQDSFPLTTNNILVNLGENADLDITALSVYNLGGANNRYQWFKDGVAVTATPVADPALHITGFTAAEAGTYICHVTNTVATELTLYSEELLISAGECGSQDRDALMALYNSTDGDNWTHNTNWGSTEPIDTWYGITVENCRVTEIFLNNNNLTGTIPPEIGSLVNLSNLFLRNNQLSSIPTEIGNLANLHQLLLSFNQLSSIPAEIGNLTNLSALGLGKNQLTSLPSTIGNLTNLVEMHLTENQLSGMFPDLSGLSNLAMLFMENNLFTFEAVEPVAAKGFSSYSYSPQDTFPLTTNNILVTWGESADLDITALSVNNLGGANNRYQWFKDGVAVTGISASPVFSIAGFSSADEGTYICHVTNTVATGLTLYSDELVISGGECGSLDYDALMALYNSTDGDNWTNNTNWGTLPISDWYGITVENCRVTKIDLNNNNLTGTIPPEIGSLDSLKYLDLSYNQLSNTIPLSNSIPDVSGYLTKLQYLNLSNNQFSGEVPPGIINLSGLASVYVNDNQLSGVLPDLMQLTNLNTLWIQNNLFTFEAAEPGKVNYNFPDYIYAPQDSFPLTTDTISISTGVIMDLDIKSISINNLGGENNRYQWFKDGVAVTGITEESFIRFVGFSSADEGTYICHVTNTEVPGLTLYSEKLVIEEDVVPGQVNVLVDFGASEAQNEFNEIDYPGWNTLVKSQYDDWYNLYTTADGGNVSGIIPIGFPYAEFGDDRSENYYGVKGPGMPFKEGETVIATWYNNTDSIIRFYPMISFTDDNMSEYSTAYPTVYEWRSMSFAEIPPKNYIKTIYEINKQDAENHSLVSIAPRFANKKQLILDKIEIAEKEWIIPAQDAFSDVRKTRTITAHVFTGHQLSSPLSTENLRFIPNGTITPGSDEGNLVQFEYGSDATFTFEANDPVALPYCHLYVDGELVDAGSGSYTFTNVTRDHVISVGFFASDTTAGNKAVINIRNTKAGTTGPSGRITVPKGVSIFPKYIPQRRMMWLKTFIDGAPAPDVWENVARRELHLLDIQSDHDIDIVYYRHYVEAATYYYTEEDLKLYKSGDEIPENTIHPESVKYMGAFRVPMESISDEQYQNFGESIGGIAFNPNGDPGNTDEYLGSLFGAGHPYKSTIGEIKIPVPVNSKNINDLPTAEYTQKFTMVTSQANTSGGVKELIYLPSQDKVFWSRGKGSYASNIADFAWSDATLGSFSGSTWIPNPQTSGFWFAGNSHKKAHVFFEIPSDWAAENLSDPNKTLAVSHVANGINFYAISPWTEGNPPADLAELSNIPLLEYGFSPQREMHRYSRSAAWFGGAWARTEDKQALIIAEKQGYGHIWYHGHTYGSAGESDNSKIFLNFYNPDDLAAVQSGEKQLYEPQPYAKLDISSYFWTEMYQERTGFYGNGAKTGGMAYDPVGNYIYIAEALKDGAKPIIHVFKIVENVTSVEDNDLIFKKEEEDFCKQNAAYPQPFSSQLTIPYTLDEPGKVSIRIFDVSGQQIYTLLNNEPRPTGEHYEIWNTNGKSLKSGIYFYRIETNKGTETCKIMKVND